MMQFGTKETLPTQLQNRGAEATGSTRATLQPTTESVFLRLEWYRISAPSQTSIDAMTTSLADIQARSNILPQYLAAGFTSPIAAFLANGNSHYHAGSAELTKRLSSGLQFSAAY